MVTKFSTLTVFATLLGYALTTHSFAMEIEKEYFSTFYSNGLLKDPLGNVKIERRSNNSVFLSAFKFSENSSKSKFLNSFINSTYLQEKEIGFFLCDVMPTKSFELRSLGNEQYKVSVQYKGGSEVDILLIQNSYTSCIYDLYVTEPRNYYDYPTVFKKALVVAHFFLALPR